jgi:hypothetical protein
MRIIEDHITPEVLQLVKQAFMAYCEGNLKESEDLMRRAHNEAHKKTAGIDWEGGSIRDMDD